MTDFAQPPPGGNTDTDDELTELGPAPRSNGPVRRAATEQLPAVRPSHLDPEEELLEGTEPGVTPSPSSRPPSPRRAATEPLLPRMGGSPAPHRPRPLPSPASDPWAAAIASPASPEPTHRSRPPARPEERDEPVRGASAHRLDGGAAIGRPSDDVGAELAASRSRSATSIADEDSVVESRTAPLSRAELAAAISAAGTSDDEDSVVESRTAPLSRADLAAAISAAGNSGDEDSDVSQRTAPLSRAELAAAISAAGTSDDEDSDVSQRTAPLSRADLAAALNHAGDAAGEDSAIRQRTAPVSFSELADVLIPVSRSAGEANPARRADPLSNPEAHAAKRSQLPSNARASTLKLPAAAAAPAGPSHRSQPAGSGLAWELPAVAAAVGESPRRPRTEPDAAALGAFEARTGRARGASERPGRSGSPELTPAGGRARVAAAPASQVPQARPQSPVLSAAMTAHRDGVEAAAEPQTLTRRILARPLPWLLALAALGLLLGASLGFLIG